jgi:hypothetical protein
MDEESMLEQWNDLRSQIIQSQVAPALVLIGIAVLATLDLFKDAPDSAKFLVLGLAAITGILATISQYAAVREGEALLLDLKNLEKPSVKREITVRKISRIITIKRMSLTPWIMPLGKKGAVSTSLLML